LTAGTVGERLLLTLWVGTLWAIGFIAVPAIFAHFDDVVIAGELAGKLFTIVNYLGLSCGTVLSFRYILLGRATQSLWRFWLTLLMLLLVAFLHFYLQAEMAAIKLLEWRADSVLSDRFDFLHQASTVVYMVISLLGLALVVSSGSRE